MANGSVIDIWKLNEFVVNLELARFMIVAGDSQAEPEPASSYVPVVPLYYKMQVKSPSASS